MADMQARLLPPRSVERSAVAQGQPARPIFQGLGAVVNLKKRGQGIRSWLRIDSGGNSQIMELDKVTIMRRCDLPARDLRLLDPLFVYPSTILGREKAIVVNLEQIRCIITADEVLLLNSLDSYVLQYVHELQRRLATRPVSSFRWQSSPPDGQLKQSGIDFSSGDAPVKDRVIHDSDMLTGYADDLPFEFRALEVALEAACTFLDTQATELEVEAYPVLDELTAKISTLNLEHVRRLKSRLVALTRRVQKVRDEIEQLMDDDDDMAELYLTEKREHMEAAFQKDQALLSYASFGTGTSMSAPVSPVSSPPESRKLDRTLSAARSKHSSIRSYDDDSTNIEELEMLLEAYFVVIECTLNKLTSLKEYIDDTEDFINIQLDNVRNQLIQFELLLTTATFVVAIYGVVAGVFGMNIPIDLYDDSSAFKWVILITGIFGLTIFGAFLWFFKRKGLVFL